MKADINIKTGDFFSLAQSWYMAGMHTDINVRCALSSKPVFKCHKIIIRQLLEKELQIDLRNLNSEADEIIIPHFLPEQFEEYVRYMYGFDQDYKEKHFSHEVQLNPLEIKVEEENSQDEDGGDNNNFESVHPVISEAFGTLNLAYSASPMILQQIGALQGIQEKVCPFCQKVFKRQDHLTRHLLQHTGEKPHQCTLCFKTYTRKDKLKGHYKKHHPDKVFICFCSTIFFSEPEFEQHIKANPDHYKDSSAVMDTSSNNMDTSGGGHESDEQENDNQNSIQQKQELQTATSFVKKEVEDLEFVAVPSAAQSQAMKFDEDAFNASTQDVKPKISVKKKKKKAKKSAKKNDSEEEGGGGGEGASKKEYPCNYCQIVFTTLKKRKAHYIGDHYETLKENGLLFTHNNHIRIKKHKCPVDGCERSFRHLCEVQDHVNVVHKKEKNYVCELCSKAFPYKKTLRHHMDIKHDIHKKESILCPKCGDIFTSKAKLQTHIASKHKIRVAKFQCKFCDFKTHAKNVITEHERTHTGEKPEICQWCGKGFNAKKTLKNHERLHTGEKPYQCKLCSSSFAQRTSLNVHMNSHHKSDIPADLSKDEKPYTYKHNNYDNMGGGGSSPPHSDAGSGSIHNQGPLHHPQAHYEPQFGAGRDLSAAGNSSSTPDPNDNTTGLKTEFGGAEGGGGHMVPPGGGGPSPGGGHIDHDRGPLAMDYRHSSDLEASYAEAARAKMSEEAALLSLKALNKLRNNEGAPPGPFNYAWMKD